MLKFNVTLWYEINFNGTCILNAFSYINTTFDL